MEGASLNTAENSGLPTGQLILLQNSTNSNKKSSSELGDAKDSGCHCVEGRLDDGSGVGVGVGVGAGAGAIAGPRADVRLVSSNSLSELVWSPCKGLRVKCAKCSIHDNVIPPPSQSLTIRETVYANISMTKEGLNKDKDLEVLTKKIEKSITDIPKDDDQSIRKGKEICDQMDLQIIDGSFSRTTRSNVPKRTPIPGPDSGTYNGFFIGGKGNPGLASADLENKKGTFSNQFASVETSKSQEDPSPILCSPSRRDDKLSVSEDVKSNKMIIGFNQVPRGKQESISENDLQLVKGESEQTEVDKLKSALPYEDNPLAETSPDDNKIPCCQAAESDTNDKEISSNPVGREENVLLKVEATAWKSGDEDDSHESVESCSSTGLFLTRKRPLGYKEKLVCDEKRLKNENFGNPESTSPHPRNSSFISWISNMMKGVDKANTDATPLALTVIPHHENDQSVDLHKTNQESGSIAGFEGIFKAMYCPTLNMRGTRILPLDHTPEEVSKNLSWRTRHVQTVVLLLPVVRMIASYAKKTPVQVMGDLSWGNLETMRVLACLTLLQKMLLFVWTTALVLLKLIAHSTYQVVMEQVDQNRPSLYRLNLVLLLKGKKPRDFVLPIQINLYTMYPA
ncbi:hypothetical protein Sjap_006367 [Stephania japonica]|uniref:Uncharacterized protein n=1 Tax=Stephania japonica TaxID=461633 RepID=A0AAP0K7E6_9MAGN